MEGVVHGYSITAFNYRRNCHGYLGVLSSNSFDITAMQMYIDPASVVITFGGSICSTIGCFKLADGINGFKSISLPFKDKTYDPSQTIRTIIDMSNVGRKEGLLALKKLQTELKTNS